MCIRDRHRIEWRKLTAKDGASGAIDRLARAAQHMQKQAAAARTFCSATSAPAQVLQLLQYASLYHLESIPDEQVLWLFHLPEGPSIVPDAALEGLEGTCAD